MATTTSAAPPAALPGKRRFRVAHPVADLVVRRLALGVLTLLLVTMLVFFATTVLPGNAATAALGTQATPQRLHALEQRLHLDEPMVSRYITWLGDLVHGNPGNSLISNQPVGPIVRSALENSLVLVVIAGLVSSVLGIALGVLAAARRDSVLDSALSGVSLFLVAIPEFVIGIVLVIFFSTVVWHVLPAVSLIPEGSSPLSDPELLVLPIVTLVLITVPYLFRTVRAAMIEALGSEYVEMAELMGVSRRRVLFVHALPTVLPPVVQVIAVNLLYLAGGIIVVEYLFNFPGVGQLLVESITARDIPSIQWIILLLATFYILVNIAADAIALAVTPRRRLPRRG